MSRHQIVVSPRNHQLKQRIPLLLPIILTKWMFAIWKGILKDVWYSILMEGSIQPKFIQAILNNWSWRADLIQSSIHIGEWWSLILHLDFSRTVLSRYYWASLNGRCTLDYRWQVMNCVPVLCNWKYLLRSIVFHSSKEISQFLRIFLFVFADFS